jgi:hypothetical protein
MSVEKFIRGKVDDKKHEGKASEVRRLAEANQQLKDHRLGHDFYTPIFPIRTAEPYRGRGGIDIPKNNS